MDSNKRNSSFQHVQSIRQKKKIGHECFSNSTYAAGFITNTNFMVINRRNRFSFIRFKIKSRHGVPDSFYCFSLCETSELYCTPENKQPLKKLMENRDMA